MFKLLRHFYFSKRILKFEYNIPFSGIRSTTELLWKLEYQPDLFMFVLTPN